MGTLVAVEVAVPVLSIASVEAVQPTALKPALYARMSVWPAAARPWTNVL